jgi:hypothetical protein
VKYFLIAVLLLAARFCGAEPETNLLSRLQPIPPFPEVAAAAKTAGIPLDGIHPSTNSGALASGDSVTALITLHQKGNRRTQWLVYFQIGAGTNSAKAEKSTVLYNSMGDKFEFVRSPVTFNIRTLGPYVDSDSFWGNPVPKDKHARAFVDGSFLSLGLDKGAAAIYRFDLEKEKTKATNFDFWVSSKPPDAKKINRNRTLAAALHVTPDEERALAGWSTTMYSYFNAVGETPNLDTILLKVLDFPSLWSIVKHGGVTAWIWLDLEEVRPLELPAQWDLPGDAPVYTLPLSVRINDQPAMNATLLITNPHPPLLACGGIIGFVAEDPADSENYMTLRVISAH